MESYVTCKYLSHDLSNNESIFFLNHICLFVFVIKKGTLITTGDFIHTSCFNNSDRKSV